MGIPLQAKRIYTGHRVVCCVAIKNDDTRTETADAGLQTPANRYDVRQAYLFAAS